MPAKNVFMVQSILAFSALALIVSGASYIKKGNAPVDAFNGLTAAELSPERSFWKEVVDEKGAAAAYTEFKARIASETYQRKHALAHVFGELVYETEGIGGVTVCDASFGFGCFHSFFGTAIHEEGIEVVKKLDGACVAVYGPQGTGCSHGIGHGVLSYLGEEGLQEALDVCAGLAFKGAIGGCSSGVFMEYNFRTMEGPEGPLRPFTYETRYYPCSELSPYRTSCYFELPQWWKSSLKKEGYSKEEAYEMSGLWCTELRETEERDACFKGIGNMIPANNGYDVGISVDECARMPHRKGELLCRQGAAWGFFVDPTYRDEAIRLCTLGIDEGEQNTCISQYKII